MEIFQTTSVPVQNKLSTSCYVVVRRARVHWDYVKLNHINHEEKQTKTNKQAKQKTTTAKKTWDTCYSVTVTQVTVVP